MVSVRQPCPSEVLGHYSRRRVFYLIRNRWLFVLRDYSLWTTVRAFASALVL